MLWRIVIVALLHFNQFCLSLNVETRQFQAISPAKSISSSFNFGTSIAVKQGSTSTVYVGAPSYNIGSGSNATTSGTVYSCPFDGTRSGYTECRHRIPFQKQGAMGISVELDPNGIQLIACGHLYHHTCTNSSELIVGYCYSRNIRRNETFPLSNPCPSYCPGALFADIVFSIDESTSLSEQSFNASLEWLVTLISSFKIQRLTECEAPAGEDSYANPTNSKTSTLNSAVTRRRSDIDKGNVRIGVYTFHKRATRQIALSQHTFAQLTSDISKIKRTGGGTSIYNALVAANGEFAVNGRNKDKQIVLLTDGFKDATDAIFVESQARIMRLNGIDIVSVGVGAQVSQADLLKIAGNESRVFSVASHGSLNTVVDGLRKVITQSAVTTLEGSGSTNTTNLLSRCQLGFSSSISKYSDLYTGAVGSYDSAGSVVAFIDQDETVSTDFKNFLNTSSIETIFAPETIRQLTQSYIGYSVTSGNFYGETTEYVASGAPRYQSKGKVALYQAGSPPPATTRYAMLHPPTALWQLGSYFGHSVLGMDINKDSVDDLLVSAPLYSDKAGFDQGRVFVFVNNPKKPGLSTWTNSTYTPQVLRGTNTPGARFGMSIVNVGDLDQNGCDEVLIGASTEDGKLGAVYIYYTSTVGISESYYQKILGRALSTSLVNFGYSAAGRPVDVDSNGFPDVVVSAPSSDNVVVLRSRPIVDVTTNITFTPSSIGIMDCLKKPSKACGFITVCISGKLRRKANNELFNMESTLDIDSLMMHRRLLFINSTLTSISDKNLTVSSNQFCSRYAVQIHAEGFKFAGQDATQPARIKYAYNLTTSFLAMKMSPVLDFLQPSYAAADWPFSLGCQGNGTSCKYDLSLEVSHTLPAADPYVIALNPRAFTLKFLFRNKGPHDAHFTQMTIDTGKLPLPKFTGDCVTIVSSTNGVIFLNYAGGSAGNNYMPAGQSCSFTLQYSLSLLQTQASLTEIFINATVYSSLNNVMPDSTPSDNNFVLQRKLLFETEVSLAGNSFPETVFVVRKTTTDSVQSLFDAALGGNATNVHHQHEILNQGPNVVNKATITLKWPEQSKDQLPLLYLYQLSCLPASVCQCNLNSKVDRLELLSSMSNPVKLNVTTNTVLPAKTTCSDAMCNEITCVLRNLKPFTSVDLSAYFKIWLPTLSQKNFTTTLSSNVHFDPSTSPLHLRKPIFDSAANTAVTDQPPVEKKTPTLNIAVIIGAIIGGLVLVIIIVVVMWKAGFFNSKYAEMLKEAGEEGAAPAAEQEPANLGGSTANLVE